MPWIFFHDELKVKSLSSLSLRALFACIDATLARGKVLES